MGILGSNRPEWMIADLASMAVGAAPAGIYATSSAEQIEYILRHAECSVVCLENRDALEKVQARRAALPKLRHIVLFDDVDGCTELGVLSWAQLLVPWNGDHDEAAFEHLIDELEPSQLATLIYTSGTTGPPKGVMLTHRNLSFTADLARRLVELRSDDCSVSYLPLSHIAEQMFTIHGSITVQSAVYLVPRPELLPEYLREVQPTIFFGVPRVWEKIRQAVRERLGKLPKRAAAFLTWCQRTALEANRQSFTGSRLGPLLALRYAVAKRVLAKVKSAMGLGRARICISSAAPIGKDVLEFFASLDVVVQEVYGQSETSGPTTFNPRTRMELGSVGALIDGVAVRIADDGEILVQGENVFAGYFKDEAATALVLKEGWLFTGDVGALRTGFLYLSGRKKELIITSGGKNISPLNLEAALKEHPLIQEAVVVGDGRPFLTALLVVAESGADVSPHIAATNARFSRVEQIKHFRVLPGLLTVENGALTPTLKVRRNVVHERYADLIAQMYQEL